MTSEIPYPYSQEQALKWITSIPPGEFVRAITLHGALIGCCGFKPIVSKDDPDPSNATAEIGYWLGIDYWGQGYATEAGSAIVEECKKSGYTKIISGHFHDNPASGRVLKKLGFQHTGQKDWSGHARQKFVPAECYELIAS